MTEQHSKDEKERKGTKKKTSKGSADCKSWPRRAGELCAGLRLLRPMARSPMVRSLIRESVRSIHREIYIQRNIRHLRKATGYNTHLPRKRKMHHFKTQSTQLHPELGLKSIKNGGPRLKTHFQQQLGTREDGGHNILTQSKIAQQIRLFVLNMLCLKWNILWSLDSS